MVNHIKHRWPPEALAELKRRWESGETGPQIARYMPQYTAKAICSKALAMRYVRHGQHRSRKAFINHGPQDPQRPFLFMQRRDGDPDPVLIDGQPVTLLDVTSRQCRWIVDDNDPVQLCANPTRKGSWCETHWKRCFPEARA